MKDGNYYEKLLKRYLENKCTPDEVIELMKFLEKDSSNRLVLSQMKAEFDHRKKEKHQITPEQSGRIRKNLLQNIIDEKPVKPMRTRTWTSAAAAAIILVATGFYLSGYFSAEHHPSSSGAQLARKTVQQDVLPGSNKAVLTLSDGSMVSLDSSEESRLIRQGHSNLTIQKGTLAYGHDQATTGEILYNTVSTPHGGQYHVELPDGTQVWLNAASSIRFPTAFAGNERRVEMAGEVYFEVAKNPGKPFFVKVNTASIKVLGTHFNIMAYPEEAAMKTTLLEGAVKFTNEASNQVLRPGQQSQLTKNGQLKLFNDVDVEEVVAWKNGFFHFETADLETVLRHICRWYDVQVVYKGKKAADLFYVDIPRNTTLSEALKVLKLASGARFEIDGKKVIVMQ